MKYAGTVTTAPRIGPERFAASCATFFNTIALNTTGEYRRPRSGRGYSSSPMNRFTSTATCWGSAAAARNASRPTTTSRDDSNSTADAVVSSPSALGRITGCPAASSVAAAE